MKTLEGAAYHEAAHAVIDYLLDIHLSKISICWETPTDATDRCVLLADISAYSEQSRALALIAGIIGAQIGKGSQNFTRTSLTFQYLELFTGRALSIREQAFLLYPPRSQIWEVSRPAQKRVLPAVR